LVMFFWTCPTVALLRERLTASMLTYLKPTFENIRKQPFKAQWLLYVPPALTH
jgi:hypothetical protein